MKIFVYCFREFDEKEFFDVFAEKYGIEYGYTAEYPDYDNAVLAKGYDAVSFTPCDMGKKMIDRFYELGVKYFATRSIGYDHIDLEYAKSLGIGVSKVSYPPDTVADYTVMLMLMCCKKMGHILKRSELQDYSLKGKIGKNLKDCTVGIIGTGSIGSAVVKRLTGFGCKILAYDPFENDSIKGAAEYVNMNRILSESDIISLHTPGSDENHHLLNADAFSKMKDGVMIINTARGRLIDTDALIDAVERGKIEGAALDVLENEDGLYYANRMGEPIAKRSMAVLRSFPNVILTPHTAFYSREVVSNMAEKTVKCVADMAEGIDNIDVIVMPSGN